VLTLQSRGLSVLSRDFILHCLAIGVVVSQRGVDLGQGEMAVFSSDFLRSQPLLVHSDNRPDQHAGAGDVWAAVLDAPRAGDQPANVNWSFDNFHEVKMTGFRQSVNRALSG